MAVSGNGQHVLTSCDDQQVRLWDLNNIEDVQTLNVARGGAAGSVGRVAISEDGKRGLTVNREARRVRVWDLTSGAEIRFPVSKVKQGPFIQLSERSILWSARFSTDGRRVLTIGGDEARLWDLVDDATQSLRERMRFSPHGAVADAALSPIR